MTACTTLKEKLKYNVFRHFRAYKCPFNYGVKSKVKYHQSVIRFILLKNIDFTLEQSVFF